MSAEKLRQLPFMGWLPGGRHLVIAIPYLWMVLFFSYSIFDHSENQFC